MSARSSSLYVSPRPSNSDRARQIRGDDSAHFVRDLRQILLGEWRREVEVVVEAFLDRRADAESHARESPLHGLRHDVGRSVAQRLQGLRPAGADHREIPVDRDRLTQVVQFPVETDTDGRLRKSWANALSHLEEGGASLHFTHGAVGQRDPNHPCLLYVAAVVGTAVPRHVERGANAAHAAQRQPTECIAKDWDRWRSPRAARRRTPCRSAPSRPVSCLRRTRSLP
jgi:hypothetical protein